MKENISKELKGVADATEEVTKSTEEVSKQFKKVKKEMEVIGPTGEKSVRSFYVWEEVADTVGDVSDSLEDVTGSAKKAGDALKGAGDSAGMYRDENGRLRDSNGKFVKETDKLNKGLGKQEGFFKRAANAAKSYAGVIATALGGAAIAGFGKSVLQTGMDFDAAMSEVQALSGATGADLGKLREKAKQMGATTKFSAIESAEAFKYMSLI